MPRVPNTMEEVFEGEHLGPLIQTLERAIDQAREAGEDDPARGGLQVECRLEPRGGRSRQTRLLEVDPGVDPIPEAVVQEIYRHYLELAASEDWTAADGGFRGTLRMNFRQKGNSQVVYESFQRAIVVPSEADDDVEEYYGGPGLDVPHMDLTLQDPDEVYMDGAPSGVLTAGRVGGLTAKHADYMFLPLYQEQIATGERRNDALLRTLIEGQSAIVEMHRTATESNTSIIERILERLPRGALQPGETQEEGGRGKDQGMSDWLGSMLISQVKKSLLPGKKSSRQVREQPPGALGRPNVEKVNYDGWGEAPTFGVPAVHSSEWDDAPGGPPSDFGPPPSGGGGPGGVDLLHEIRRMSSEQPGRFRQLVQDNSDELLPVFMDAFGDDGDDDDGEEGE